MTATLGVTGDVLGKAFYAGKNELRKLGTLGRHNRVGSTFEGVMVLHFIQRPGSDLESPLGMPQVIAHTITTGSLLTQLRFQLLDSELQWLVFLHTC